MRKKGPFVEGRPAEVLALRYELGRLFAAISFGLRRALRLGLRVADGLSQHLAKLGLSLWRFARAGLIAPSKRSCVVIKQVRAS